MSTYLTGAGVGAARERRPDGGRRKRCSGLMAAPLSPLHVATNPAGNQDRMMVILSVSYFKVWIAGVLKSEVKKGVGRGGFRGGCGCRASDVSAVAEEQCV